MLIIISLLCDSLLSSHCVVSRRKDFHEIQTTHHLPNTITATVPAAGVGYGTVS